jgi:NhaP-type Na+/H+ or K+/H+ antiporter
MQVTLGPLAGVVIGGLGAWLIDRAATNGWMEESYEGLAILGVAFLAFAGSEIIGGNGFIAAVETGSLPPSWAAWSLATACAIGARSSSSSPKRKVSS